MTKLTFWNLQRLGQGTDLTRRQMIAAFVDSLEPDFQLFCELTTASEELTPVNLTYRKKNARQLCYAARDSDGDNMALRAVTPPASPEYAAAGFKGGNDFTRLADRALADLGILTGVHVYLIHARASNSSALKEMAYIAAGFANRADKWLVVGDFNITPDDLLKGAALHGIAAVVDPLIRRSGHPTWARGDQTREYDYVLASPGLPVTVTTDTTRTWFDADVSDHGWIMVEY